MITYIFLKIVHRAGSMPKVCQEEGLRGMLQEMPWIEYHTTASGTPVLVKEVSDAYPDLARTHNSFVTIRIETNLILKSIPKCT